MAPPVSGRSRDTKKKAASGGASAKPQPKRSAGSKENGLSITSKQNGQEVVNGACTTESLAVKKMPVSDSPTELDNGVYEFCTDKGKTWLKACNTYYTNLYKDKLTPALPSEKSVAKMGTVTVTIRKTQERIWLRLTFSDSLSRVRVDGVKSKTWRNTHYEKLLQLVENVSKLLHHPVHALYFRSSTS